MSAASIATRSTTTTATARSPMSPAKARHWPRSRTRSTAPVVGRRRMAGREQRRAAGPLRGRTTSPGTSRPNKLCDADGRAARLLLTRSSTRGPPNQLFLNNGDGTFTDVSAEIGDPRADPGKGMGVGGRRLRPATGAWTSSSPTTRCTTRLFHNKGGGKFEEVAFEAGVALRRGRRVHLRHGRRLPRPRQRRLPGHRLRGARRTRRFRCSGTPARAISSTSPEQSEHGAR